MSMRAIRDLAQLPRTSDSWTFLYAERVRVERAAYAAMSAETGVKWRGRDYKQANWGASDPVNRALSAANACLYGVCHAAIVATGFSPALGFLHVGKQLSFVYDIADLYKVELTIPMAFQVVAESSADVESRVRRLCRESFYSGKLLERIVPDLQSVVGLARGKARLVTHRGEEEPAEETAANEKPSELWEPGGARIAGGTNFGERPGLAKARKGTPVEAPSDAYDGDLVWPPTGSDSDDEVPF